MGSINILEKINLELQREVRLLRSTTKKTDPVALLGPHQTALNRIIREVKSIKPALSSIKNAYDNVFHSLLEQSEQVPMLKSTLARLADERDQDLIKNFEELTQIKKENEREKKELVKELKKSELGRLDQKEIIKKLKEDMGNLYEQFLEEKASRRLLITDLNSRTQEEQRKEDKVETKDPVHLEIARDQARKDLAVAREELATIRAEYNDVVPRKLWETAENNLKDAKTELATFNKENTELKNNFAVLKSTYEKVEKERNEVVAERNHLKRTGTPRPDWESIYEKTFDEKFGDSEISSDKRAKYLLDELIKSKDNTEKEYFTVPTEQTDLPAFLKSEERTEVKNLKLTIYDCNQIKEEIWKERLSHKNETDEIDVFVKNFLSNKYNFYALDFGYSLRAAAEKFADLQHIAEFYQIVSGQKPEQGFKRTVEQTSELLSALQRVDRHKKGFVLVFDLKVELRKLFKMKPDEHFEIIAQMAEEDKFYYSELFENGQKGESSKMMSVLAEQDEKEKDIYTEQLAVQLEGIDAVGAAEAKIAFMSVDPGINAELINKYIQIGLKASKSLTAEEFIFNLKSGPVYRISPAVELF